ncbi:MAG: hypothetical protein CVV25_07735 [Ignavibacteriae bacterium HGW-Ignavibacteriae-4]|jgi:CheY-like chemotaxis protein|nr:MAG: hypothetical protein CVV25_07735 [Ignavibacteriae bacterium HGW-Ignavibacteriae-4]
MDRIKSYTKLNIILVEDSEISHLVALSLLESLGLNVHSAYNGSECLSILSNNKSDYFDLIFMDLQMPIMDGITTVEKIRKNKSYDKIKIIILSADDIETSNLNLIEKGIHSYTKKPVSKDSIVKTLNELFSDLPNEMNKISDEVNYPKEDNSILDIKNTLPRLDNNRILYKDLIYTFTKNQKFFVKEFIALSEVDDFEIMKLKLHTLKGDSRNIGALRLSTEVEKFEYLFIQNPFKPNNINMGSIEIELLNLANRMEELDELLLIDNSNVDQIINDNNFSFEYFLQELIELLDNCNYEAKLYVKQASNYKNEHNKFLIEKLESEVNDFNYEEGLVIATSLKSEVIG